VRVRREGGRSASALFFLTKRLHCPPSFIRVQEAHEILTDESKRRAYEAEVDAWEEHRKNGGRRGGGGGARGDYENLQKFREMQERFRRQQEMRQGRHHYSSNMNTNRGGQQQPSSLVGLISSV
jgi:DnaJ-class molecular chaperone